MQKSSVENVGEVIESSIRFDDLKERCLNEYKRRHSRNEEKRMKSEYIRRQAR